MCLRFVFLLITRVAAGLRLSRREEMWKTTEILILPVPCQNSRTGSELVFSVIVRLLSGTR
jgi:hypothetical protein